MLMLFHLPDMLSSLCPTIQRNVGRKERTEGMLFRTHSIRLFRLSFPTPLSVHPPFVASPLFTESVARCCCRIRVKRSNRKGGERIGSEQYNTRRTKGSAADCEGEGKRRERERAGKGGRGETRRRKMMECGIDRTDSQADLYKRSPVVQKETDRVIEGERERVRRNRKYFHSTAGKRGWWSTHGRDK